MTSSTRSCLHRWSTPIVVALALALAVAATGTVAVAETIPAGWWTLRGPSGVLAERSVVAQVVGARDDGELFLSADAGLWRGGAQSWRRAEGSPAFIPFLVVASPTRPELVVAATDLLSPTLHPRALTFPPIVTGFVEVSRDGGATFGRCFAEPPLPTSGGRWFGQNRAIADVAFDPDAPTRLFLATSDGLLSLDVDRCPEHELRDARSLNAVIAVRGGAGTVLLVATRDPISDLRRSADGGASWSLAIPDGPQRARRWALASQPGDQSVAWALAGTSPEDLFQNKDLSLELWRSERNGRSWSRRSELPWRGVPADLVVDQAGRLFASLDGPDGWRLVRSVDGGRTWLEVTPAAAGPARIALAAGELARSSAGRLFETSDAGDSWRELETPTAPDAGRTVVVRDEIVVLEPEAWSSADGGVTWLEAEPLFPDDVTQADLAALRRSPSSGAVYATVFALRLEARVVASEDGGLTWTTLLDSGSSAPTVLAVVEGGASRGEDVLLGARPCNGVCHPEFNGFPAETGEVLRSEDGGATWVEVSRPFIQLLTDLDAKTVGDTTVVAVIGSGFLGLPTRVDILQLSLDGGVTFSASLPLPLLAGGLHWVRVLDAVGDQVSLLLGTQSGIHRTEDSGATWQRVGLHPAAYTTLPPAFDLEDDGRLWVATDRAGVFESVDEGRTWYALPGLAAGLVIRDLAFDAETRTLWAATAAGLFARSRPLLGACQEGVTGHCLAGGRFLVEARFRSEPGSEPRVATASPITTDTGAFWFFDSQNVELLVKVLEGCAINGSWWVFATGLTDVEVELVVTDTANGAEQRFHSAAGAAFRPIFDTSAFLCP
jgi:photosystem II stability/assembly factor-like uncharacterized protein